jgi:hypothetical protein
MVRLCCTVTKPSPNSWRINSGTPLCREIEQTPGGKSSASAEWHPELGQAVVWEDEVMCLWVNLYYS